jgi:hypothetical protein
MADDRDTLLQSIEDFEATLVELRTNTVVVASPGLLIRLQEIESAANALGDPILAATIEKLRIHLATGRSLDG